MSKKLDLLSGQEAKIRTKIQNYERDIEKARDIAIKAKSKMAGLDESSTEYMRMKNTAALNANQVGRLDSSKNDLTR